MRTTPADRESARPDDRSTRARIRDAAVRCFAEHGRGGTTARRVAAEAGVSPGSVIHHFGTMDGLRQACDEHVVRTIRERKVAAVDAGLELDLLAALRDAPVAELSKYLARMLVDESAAAPLVDELVADAQEYLERGVAAGLVRPSEDPGARAVVVMLFSLGALVLHSHLHRLLGVDLVDPQAQVEDLLAYARPVYELYGQGLVTAEFASAARAAFDAAAEPDPAPESAAAPHRSDPR